MQQDDWRPIADAPKDGTPIVACGSWEGEIAGHLQHSFTMAVVVFEDGKWNIQATDYYEAWLHPTHYIPLPPLPKAK